MPIGAGGAFPRKRNGKKLLEALTPGSFPGVTSTIPLAPITGSTSLRHQPSRAMYGRLQAHVREQVLTEYCTWQEMSGNGLGITTMVQAMKRIAQHKRQPPGTRSVEAAGPLYFPINAHLNGSPPDRTNDGTHWASGAWNQYQLRKMDNKKNGQQERRLITVNRKNCQNQWKIQFRAPACPPDAPSLEVHR